MPEERLRLQVPPEEAKRLIEERIESGTKLLESRSRGGQLMHALQGMPFTGTFREEAQAWSDHNARLINRKLFDNDSATSEFYNVTSSVIEALHRGISDAQLDEGIARSLARRIAHLRSLLQSLPLYAEEHATPAAQVEPPRGDVVFIVYGHDLQARTAVEQHLKKLGLKTRILAFEPTGGLSTLIEHLETQSQDVGAAVVIVTPDDPGVDDPRARQNVIFELGYFIGRLSRKRVLLLRRGKVEWFSDLQGAVWIPFDEYAAWQDALEKNLRAIGFGRASEA